jgi:thiosulfate reductase cytochrome b subunit
MWFQKSMRLFLVVIFPLAVVSGQNMHPVFPLLDEDDKNVLKSNNPVSTLRTCGGCHDTEYISSHSFHTQVGFDQIKEAGKTESGRPWDFSPGTFGRWNSLVYRYLPADYDEYLDLSRAEWLKLFGARHVGGGPAVYSVNGERLDDQAMEKESQLFNSQTGQIESWNWKQSGVVEMNCFLCHIPNPNNSARINALKSGTFKWANTATLLGTGIVLEKNGNYSYIRSAFGPQRNLSADYILIQEPKNDNCGFCHGLVHDNPNIPLITAGCQPEHWMTETTGQVITSQRLVDSGMNLENKNDLNRSWDIHAERLLNCIDCHHSINNPFLYQEDPESRPAHLLFSPRRLELEDYLYRPNHQFARGQSSFAGLAPELKATMRRCESCHDFNVAHPWLPYRQRHQNSVTCESCHIPKLYAPARRLLDWSILTADQKPRMECRSIDGPAKDVSTLVKGYEPVLLPRREYDGRIRFTPYNLVTVWFWTFGDPKRPVRLYDLKRALFVGNDYHPDVIRALDNNKNNKVDSDECLLDTKTKQNAIRRRLSALGLENPQLRGEIQPFAIHHNVTHGEWVVRDCQACHNHPSNTTRPFLLAQNYPYGIIPAMVQDAQLAHDGRIIEMDDKLFYQTDARASGFFILGLNSVLWVQIIGAASVILVLLGTLLHAGMRLRSEAMHPEKSVKTHQVYMYSGYERFWHWMQAAAIIGLIFTGLVIHAPDLFGFLSFEAAVWVHNILAVILVVNAFLSLFYHFASGNIKRYIPEPQGFFNQAVQQMSYYLRGIFRNQPHPFEKTPEKRLNPLQKITYLVILNILLPVQIITGILIWGAQHWPEFLSKVGGLGLLIPFHSLIAWFFAAFLLLHIYLTTTGHTPTSNIRAMIVGWEKIEMKSQESRNEQ